MKKLSRNLFSFFIFFFLFFTNLANSGEKFITSFAKDIWITDVDTIKIGKEKITLFGIHAPEIKQICKNKNNNPYFCGKKSEEVLRSLIKNSDKKIYCYYSERDRYNRIIGECFLEANNSLNINAFMVFTGNAVGI